MITDYEAAILKLEKRIEVLERAAQETFDNTSVVELMQKAFPNVKLSGNAMFLSGDGGVVELGSPLPATPCNCNPKVKHRKGCSFYHITSPRKSKYTDLLLNLPVSKDYLLLPGNKERSACVTHAAKIGVKVMMRTVDDGKVKIYRVD